MRLHLYWQLWWRQLSLVIQTMVYHKGVAFLYITGKIIRFGMILWVIITVSEQTGAINGYTTQQLVVFFLVFNLVDLLAQLFFRNVYMFRPMIREGRLDLLLLKPIHPLFVALTGRTDPLDIPLLLLVIAGLIIYLPQFPLLSWFFFFIAIIASFLLMMAIHIFVLSIGILTIEVDTFLLFFRDIWTMGRIPVSLYQPAIRWFLTFIIPVALIMTFPANMLLSLTNWKVLLPSLFLSVAVVQLSFLGWRRALKSYSGASA